MSDLRQRLIEAQIGVHTEHDDDGPYPCYHTNEFAADRALAALLPEGVGAVLLTRDEDGAVTSRPVEPQNVDKDGKRIPFANVRVWWQREGGAS